jgi:hypothetical protein
LNDGQSDRSRNRKFKYGPGYDHPDRGYNSSYGDKRTYEQQYKQAYQQGYQQGYNGGYASGNGAYVYNQGAYGQPPYGGYGQAGVNPGANMGFQDGLTDGQSDRAAGRQFKFGPGYDHPDRGYNSSYGDKGAYEQQYKQAYQQGYQQGYNGRR